MGFLIPCILGLICFKISLAAPSIQLDVLQSTLRTTRSFTIDPETHTFLKDGQPFQYISGSFHYFRIPRLYWRDRLEKAKAAGLDAIQIYIPWNFHAPEEEEYDFSNDRDVEHFLDLVQQLDMLAIVRVGPYICAEWAFGGLPPWLLRKNPTMKLRSSDYSYYKEVVNWFGVLLPKLRKYLYTEGGPIIMVQLENEYGYAAACDRDYMSMLYDLARFYLGQDIILFTTDGNSEQILRCGSPDQRYLATIDFAPTILPPNVSFASVEKFRPGQPLVNSEFYAGWYDTWGSHHSRRSANLVQESLIELMNYSVRVNVNIYVFHGGTSFGFWNGKPSTIPATTSYDFDAPLSEAGDVTYKYELLQKAIHKFRNKPLPSLPKNSTKKSYGVIQMRLTSHLLLRRGPEVEGPVPQNMEALRQYDGFMIYRATLPSSKSKLDLVLKKFADKAYIFTSDDKLEVFHWHGTLEVPSNSISLNMQNLSSHTKLVLLLENTGYVNFGDEMWNNVKGLWGDVTVDGQLLSPWVMMPIKSPLDIDETTFHDPPDKLPVQGAIYTGELRIPDSEQPEDTFLQPDGFSQGIAAVNSHIVGHFDQMLGPQLRLYVPKQFLKSGRNRLTVCELQTIMQPKPNVSSLAETKWLEAIH